jgi:hypothetical protein
MQIQRVREIYFKELAHGIGRHKSKSCRLSSRWGRREELESESEGHLLTEFLLAWVFVLLKSSMLWTGIYSSY